MDWRLRRWRLWFLALMTATLICNICCNNKRYCYSTLRSWEKSVVSAQDFLLLNFKTIENIDFFLFKILHFLFLPDMIELQFSSQSSWLSTVLVSQFVDASATFLWPDSRATWPQFASRDLPTRSAGRKYIVQIRDPQLMRRPHSWATIVGHDAWASNRGSRRWDDTCRHLSCNSGGSLSPGRPVAGRPRPPATKWPGHQVAQRAGRPMAAAAGRCNRTPMTPVYRAYLPRGDPSYFPNTDQVHQPPTPSQQYPLSLGEAFFIQTPKPTLIHVIHQGVTPCWKSVHRISGYQPLIRDIIIGYQEKIDQIQLYIKQNPAKYSNISDDILTLYLWTVVRE